MLQIYGPNAPHPMRQQFAIAAFLVASHLAAQGFETWVPQGGQRAADLYIEQELRYPAAAYEAGIGGDVVLGILVGTAGTPDSIRVVRSLTPECDAEAARLVRAIRWEVAKGVEERRAEERQFKVTFDPKRYKRWLKERHARTDSIFNLPASASMDVHGQRQVTTMARPLIKGGMKGLPAHLALELNYPEQALRYSLEGEVMVDFVVEPSGSLSNLHAVKDVGGGCTDEALRLLHRTPWAPAVLNGERVRSTMQVSILFKLPREVRP
jgi:protein TonB